MKVVRSVQKQKQKLNKIKAQHHFSLASIIMHAPLQLNKKKKTVESSVLKIRPHIARSI